MDSIRHREIKINSSDEMFADKPATVLYSNNRTDNRVVWTTSNEAVASVDENGVVIAIAPGTAVITAQASKNNAAESAA